MAPALFAGDRVHAVLGGICFYNEYLLFSFIMFKNNSTVFGSKCVPESDLMCSITFFFDQP
jgi:hypothetical protein